jgi:hypothetical protein
MAASNQMMAQMLMGNTGNTPVAQGGQYNAATASADLLRKIMMIRALKGQPPQPGQPQQDPNVIGQINAQPQAMQAQQMPGGISA